MEFLGRLKIPPAPVAGEDAARKADVDAAAMKEFALFPDYSKMESTNRISANNGTWTVDRNGFVRVSVQATAGGSVCCEINGKRVEQAFGSQSDIMVDVFPVSVGDVVKLFVDTGSPINLNCQYIPPKVVGMSVTPSLANSLVTMGPPNYSARESTDRITAVNGTWTVDRNGYVFLQASSALAGNSIWYEINGVRVNQNYNGLASNSQTFLQSIEMVSVGDVIVLKADTTTGGAFGNIICRYIPPTINPPLYVDGQLLLSYSTAEQDTGVKDLDGRTIWQKTVTGNIVAAANVQLEAAPVGGAQTLIKAEGWLQTGENTDKKQLPVFLQDSAIAHVYQRGGDIIFGSRTAAARSGTTNNAYRVTLWYTKA